MKILIISVIVGLLAIAGFAIAVAVENAPVQETLSSCGGSSCSNGGDCVNPSCGAKTGSGCGCGCGGR